MNASFPPGYVVGGRYELVERLGQGGHGAVYRAIQHPLGREVAVKMILAEAMFADGMLERFTREAALVQRLEHPNTVRIYDFGTTETGMPFIVFELLRGRTLEQEIARGVLTPSRVGRVTTQVLKSLMEAHALGIVHRDVKPSNILLSDYSGETDFVKVLDFGVAKPVAAPAPGQAITHDGQIIGTPSYMAPEQVHGAVVGPTADLYALGLVMAEAATGVRVYDDGSAMQIWMKQTSPDAVPLSPLVISAALGPVIARATQKAPSDRYQSAGEMLEAVERALLASTGPTDPLAKPFRRSDPELPRTTAKLTRELPPAQPSPSSPELTPLVGLSPWAATHAAPAVPPAPLPPVVPPFDPRASGQRVMQPPIAPVVTAPPPAGASTAIVVLGVVAIVSLLIAAVAFGALFLSAKPNAVPSLIVPTHARLTAVTAERTERRLREAGWALVVTNIPETAGMRGTFFSAQKGTISALVNIYEYDSPTYAELTAETLRKSPGNVVERDGGRILSVLVAQDHTKSQALFDDLVK